MTVPQSPRPTLTICTQEKRVCLQYTPDNPNICGNMFNGWECAKEKGHEGEHLACLGPCYHSNSSHNLATWPNDSQPTPTEGGDEPCALNAPTQDMATAKTPSVLFTESASNAATQGAALGAAGGEPKDWPDVPGMWSHNGRAPVKVEDSAFGHGLFVTFPGLSTWAIANFPKAMRGGWVRTPVPAPSVALRPADMNAACDCGFYYRKHSGDCPAATSSSPADRDAGEEYPEVTDSNEMDRVAREAVNKMNDDQIDAIAKELRETVNKMTPEEREEMDRAVASRFAAIPPPVAPVACPDYCKLAKSTGVTCAPDECDLAIGIRSAPVAREETATPETDALLQRCTGFESIAKSVVTKSKELERRLHAIEAERDEAMENAKRLHSNLIHATAERDTARAEVARLKEERDAAIAGEQAATNQKRKLMDEISRLSGAFDEAWRQLKIRTAALAAATARTEELEKAILPALSGLGYLVDVAKDKIAEEAHSGWWEWITTVRALLATRPATGIGETIACGGCGNADPHKRCIGCLHDFFAHVPVTREFSGETTGEKA